MWGATRFVLTFFSGQPDHSESGATAVEYGLLVAMIAGVIVGVVTLLGLALPAGFQTVINGI